MKEHTTKLEQFFFSTHTHTWRWWLSLTTDFPKKRAPEKTCFLLNNNNFIMINNNNNNVIILKDTHSHITL